MLEERREFIDELSEHDLVENVDFTRDGYKTVILELGDPENGASADEEASA